ncbi:MAG TPA: YceI family protein [Puia sp.]|jgi:polyisoprenoid-binding protein YceI|nr:YceI family protein [Puia sp.]
MKKNIYPIAALLFIAASAFTVIQSQNWKIGEDYSIKFSGDNASGIFKGLKGTVNFDDANLASSKFDVAVDVATINTGSGMKNIHAKSDKWFDAEKYPTISFTSSSITKTSAGYEAKGRLTMHGVTKDFIIPFSFTKNGNDGGFASSFDINRLDFNMKTPEPDLGAATILKVDLNVPVHK